MTRIISFHRRQPRYLRPAIILFGRETLRFVGLVVLLGALVWLAGALYEHLG